MPPSRPSPLLPVALVAALAVSAAAAPPRTGAPPEASAERVATAGPDDFARDEVDRVQRVTFRRGGERQIVSGRVLVTAADGGLMLQTDDGAIWPIEGREVVACEPTDTPFAPLSPGRLADRMLAQLPDGFRIHTTPHYVVCYNTSRSYAQWTSSLLERLYRAFTNYWQRQGLELDEPEFPLVVLVFADRRQYDQAARDDLPGGTGSIVGFYSLRTNRISMYDLTGESVGETGRRGSLRDINDMLSQPASVPLVATIVHEATHQIAFNCGLQQRFADLPLWLCEGMAVYFEAPDLSSTRGWRGIGKVNYPRLETFRENLPNWREGSLEKLLADDQLFRNPKTAVDAYAAAWALNYYLIKYQPDQYAAYLQTLAKKQPLRQDTPQTRMDDFRRAFGDPGDLERDFLKQLSRVK